MNKQRIAILACAVLGMLATFMPWAKVFIASVDGTQGDGWITFFIFAVPVVLTFLGDRTKSLDITLTYIAVSAGLVNAGIGVWKIVDFNHQVGKVSDNIFGQMMGSGVSVGFGLYVVVLAGIALAITALGTRTTTIAVTGEEVL